MVFKHEVVFLDRNVWSDSKIHKFKLPEITIVQAGEWRGEDIFKNMKMLIICHHSSILLVSI